MNERQQRFLLAYTEQPTIAAAARRAGVHRATIYRWKADPAFVTALRGAFAAWHRAHVAQVAVKAAARAAWRAEREAARLPERTANLARALEIRRQKRGY